MTLDDRQLTALLRHGDEREREARSDCPEEGVVAAYVEGRSSDVERSRLEAHLAGCRRCLGELGVLSRLRLSGDPPPPVPEWLLDQARGRSRPAARAAAGGSRWALAALAASLVAALGTAFWLPGRGPGGDLPVRAAIVRSGALEIVHPKEGVSLVRTGAVIRWTEVDGALSYRVLLATAEGDLLWQGEARAPSARIPDRVVLEADRLYFVWVHALLADGKTLKSPAVGFQIHRRP